MKTSPPPLVVATPCPKKWEELSGGHARRFCDQCNLHVHNLSAMTRKERTSFVENPPVHPCVAYTVDRNGSMVSTQVRWKMHVQSLPVARWLVAAFAAAFPFLFSACGTRKVVGEVPPANSATGASSMTLGRVRMDSPKSGSSQRPTPQQTSTVGMPAPRVPAKR